MWFEDLVEYYGVTLRDAIVLGTRKSGRKPDLPGSPTCQPVHDMTFEEIWDSKPRETIQQKMDFYKDLGAWQVFRQCFYRKDAEFTYILKNIKPNCRVLEYGCGVGPVTNWLIENYLDQLRVQNIKFELVDVAGEHLEFAKWRFNKKAPDIEIVYHEITEDYPLPKFKNRIDVALLMDVLEHLPNPLAVIKNVYSAMDEFGGVLVANWLTRHGHKGYADLEEAELERDAVMKFIEDEFDKTSTPDMYIL